MRTLVIYPGRFHPFHRGHFNVYKNLTKKYGVDNVFVATSDKQAPVTSPFSFADKQNMMAKLGVPTDHVVKVKNPYQAQEITSHFDANDTVLIFVLGKKDTERISFNPKKDGSPSYMQPMPKNLKEMKPMSQHAYVELAPTVTFKVRGKDANSATEIRDLYIKGNDHDRANIIADLYGAPDTNLQHVFDKRLSAGEQVAEMLHRARNQGLTESEINWLDRARLMERAVLKEFDPGEDGFGPFKLYTGGPYDYHHVETFPTLDAAIEEATFLMDTDPRSSIFYWKVVDGKGDEAWEHNPDDIYDQMRRGRRGGFRLESQQSKPSDYLEESK